MLRDLKESGWLASSTDRRKGGLTGQATLQGPHPRPSVPDPPGQGSSGPAAGPRGTGGGGARSGSGGSLRGGPAEPLSGPPAAAPRPAQPAGVCEPLTAGSRVAALSRPRSLSPAALRALPARRLGPAPADAHPPRPAGAPRSAAVRPPAGAQRQGAPGGAGPRVHAGGGAAAGARRAQPPVVTRSRGSRAAGPALAGASPPGSPRAWGTGRAFPNAPPRAQARAD